MVVSGRSGGLPMGSAAVKAKLPLIFPLLELLAGSDEPDGDLISGLSMAMGSSQVFQIVWSDRLKRGSTLHPERKPPRGGRRSRIQLSGPLSATMRHVGAEGRDHCLWFFATRKVAACWRLLGHTELCLSLALRWVTFGHADATLHRTGLLDN